MRVLIFTFEFAPFSGGIATYTHEVALGLGRLGWEVDVLAPNYSRAQEFDESSPFRTVRMGFDHGGAELLRFLPGMRGFARELRNRRPDVVLLTSDLSHGIGGAVSRLRSVPFVPVVHGSEIAKHFPPASAKERFQSVPLGYCYRNAAAVVCVSGFVQRLMLGAGFDANRLNVIHNGIDRELLERPVDENCVAAVRRRWGVEGRPTILTIARLVRRKGQATVIEGLARVLARVPDAVYVVAGVGSDESRLRALAAKRGVEDAVVFTGEIAEADKIHLLDACDVFVMPSKDDGRRVEGLGISLLEAGARGKALIGGDHGGVPEIIEDGETGYLVDPEGVDQIADRIAELLRQDDDRLRLGRNVEAKVRDQFLTEHMAQSLDSLLATVATADIQDS